MVFQMTSNEIELHNVTFAKKAVGSTLLASAGLEGHRHPVRAVALSSDATTIVSTSNLGAKVWEVAR